MEGNHIHKALESMSQYKKDALAAATLAMFNGILAQPGGRELIERKKAEIGLTGR